MLVGQLEGHLVGQKNHGAFKITIQIIISSEATRNHFLQCTQFLVVINQGVCRVLEGASYKVKY